MDALTTPLLRQAATHAADPAATAAEVATMIGLARDRRARDIVIGSGRTPHALATTRLLASAWESAGRQTLDTVTWPETGASWLRQANRFVAAVPDLWLMVGPATGWAQMTRRLLWSTPWRPERTIATAGIGDQRALALVGLINLEGLAGASTDGTAWRIVDDALVRPAPREDSR